MAKRIPTYGRKRSEIHAELGLHQYAANVPLGNTGPTVVQGKLYNQDMPGRSMRAQGGLRTLRGKYT